VTGALWTSDGRVLDGFSIHCWDEYRRYLRSIGQRGTYCHAAKCIAGVAINRLGGPFGPGLARIARQTIVACGAAVAAIP
jgi:hypothetical protein